MFAHEPDAVREVFACMPVDMYFLCFSCATHLCVHCDLPVGWSPKLLSLPSFLGWCLFGGLSQ